MKRIFMFLLMVALCYGVAFAGGNENEAQKMESDGEKISYALGFQIGEDFRRQKIEISPELVVKGMQDAISGKEPTYSRQKMRETLVDLKKKIVAAQQADLEMQSKKNLEDGTAFLEENKKKEGVITLPSGLQYKVLKEGSGAVPKATDTVTVHYRGTLIDGTEFDSSYERGKPATFRADQVIAGWKEALQLMKEGSRWQLFIPQELAYGQRSTGRIGPNSTLIFEVELISVKSGE